MQLRRGLIFTAIHLAIAVPIILSFEISNSVAISEHYRPEFRPVSASQEQESTIPMDPCTTFVDGFTGKQEVVSIANLPALVPTGWRVQCPARWTAARALGLKWGWAFLPSDAPAQRKVDMLFILLIALQWFLIGSFPLRPSARILAQPDWFITIASATAAAIVWIHPIQGFSRLPALLAFCGWLWFAGLILWRIFKSLVRLFASRKLEQSA
jgi:hypothetical protein